MATLTISGSVVREDVRGRYPSISANDHNTVVEIHQIFGRSKLKYAVGKFTDNSTGINWKGVNDLGGGTYARVALNNKNTVIEVHEHPYYRKICYRVGVLNTDTYDTIDWDGGGELGWGRFPAVVLSNDDVVVVVYESALPGSYKTYYRVGTIVTNTDGGRKRVGTWTTERRVFHESVNELSLTMNKEGCVVAAGCCRSHQICVSAGKLTCAAENSDTYAINWSAAQNDPQSIGCCPAVSIDDQGYMVLAIQSYWGRELFYQIGKVDEQNKVTLRERKYIYDHGCYPTIALCNNHQFIEEHETNFSIPRGNRLFNHVGVFCYNNEQPPNNEEEEEA